MALFGNDTDQLRGQVDTLSAQLRQEQETNLLLEESMADLELALDDRGWRTLQASVRDELSPAGRRALADVCRTMAVSNPLIKRGLTIRIGYIWGQGVEIRAKAAEDAPQDVNAVVQRFIDDNTKTLFGSQAREELERAEGTDGNVILCAFTSPLTGRVQVRSTPVDEIVDIVTNPEDRDEPWFYVREYTQTTIEGGYSPGNTRTRVQTVKVVHPDIAFRPSTRPKTLNGAPIRWDAPMLHVPVNRLDGWKFGVPDVYAAVAWARLYKDFLVDWALVMKSLSKFTWKLSGGDKGKAQRAAAQVRANAAATGATASPAAQVTGVGQVFGASGATAGEQVSLDAIPKSGATIDADSGKPLAGMAAAGMGIPVTMLLADPGITGARAVAETLDLPTVLEMGMRRLLWEDKLGELFEYVIDQAVLAPRGMLRGTITIDDWGRKTTVLAGEVEKTIEWDWPPLIDTDPLKIIEGIVAAEGTQLVPDLVVLRLLLSALGVKDADEILAEVTDDQGRFVRPKETAAQAAVDAFNRGEDPAAAVR